MITHYDMSTGELIGQDSQERRDDARITERPAAQSRLMTVDEAAHIEHSQSLPSGAIVMLPLSELLKR